MKNLLDKYTQEGYPTPENKKVKPLTESEKEVRIDFRPLLEDEENAKKYVDISDIKPENRTLEQKRFLEDEEKFADAEWKVKNFYRQVENNPYLKPSEDIKQAMLYLQQLDAKRKERSDAMKLYGVED